MSAGRWTVYSKAKRKLFNGTINLGSDIFKILLVQTTSNFATLALSTVGSLTNQIASAGGYTQQGLPMVVSWTTGASAGAYQFSMAPVFLPAVGVPIVNIRAAVIKNSAGQLLCFATMTASQFVVPAGNTLTLAPVASGIFTLSSPISPVSVTLGVGALAVTGSQPQVTNASNLDQLVQVRPMKNYDSASTPTGFYKEFGAHFRQSDVPLTSFVEWRLTDGTTVIPAQADNKAFWADGSLRTASFTMRYPNALAASAATTLKAYAKSGTFNNTSWTSTASITGRDIRLEVTIGGITYTLAANNEVTRGTSIRQIRSGPVSSAWRIWGELRNGTAINSTPQGTIWGILYVTFFNDSTYSVFATIQPSRLSLSTAPAFTVTDYKVKDYAGPTTLFDYATTFTLFGGTPVVACNTDGLNPYSGTSVDKCVVAFPVFSLADPTTTGLYDSMAVWWQASTPGMISAISAGTSATYIPNSTGDYTDPDQTGGSTFIGSITQQAAQAMLLGSWIALRQDRIDALATLTNPITIDDAVTGYPANLTNATTYSGLQAPSSVQGWNFGTKTITITGGGVSGGSHDTSHAPLYTWYQYLATGQEWWLDMLHDKVIGNLGAANPGSATFARNPIINGTHYYAVNSLGNQSRAAAWGLRDQDNTQWVTPDTHPMKQYLTDILTNWFTYAGDYLLPPNSNASYATLGIYKDSSGIGNIESGWMHDYLLLAYSMSIRRGRVTGATGMASFHLVPWVLGRAINGCMWAAFSYRIGVNQGQSVNGAICTSWDQVWVGAGIPMSWLLTAPDGNASCPTSGVDPSAPGGVGGLHGPGSWGPGHTYPNIFECAAACAQIVGLSTASTAYTYMQAVETSAAATDAQWASSNFQWRIRVPA